MPYQDGVGAWKVEVLRDRFFRACGVEIEGISRELTDRTARSVRKEAALIVDTFDNPASRQLVQDQCRMLAVPCRHVGLFADYAEVI